MLTPFGAISIDKTSNSLIVCDTRESIDRIHAEVVAIDKTPQLLEIEVVIVDVQLDNDTEIGVNWDMLGTKTNHLSFRQSLTERITSTPANTETIGNATAFNSTGLGSDISIVTGTVREVVHLLQTNRKTQILASPRVLLVSGKSASIETVEEIPYQEKIDTSNGGNYAATQFKQVGVKLRVSATLVDANNIVLKVEPEQNINTGVFGFNSVPIIDTRRATADLMLKDSSVVIMGGLRRKQETKVRDQVPILGSIPVVGLLFGRDRVATLNSELLVFISPHIYKDGPLAPQDMKKLATVQQLPSLSIFDGEKKH
jgi:type II secretory pathway component GspD/PulD (secretin)